MLHQLVARHIQIPLKKPIKHASHERRDTENVLVECHLENGIIGYGEGVPRDYVTGETIDSALETLLNSNWADLLRNPDSFPNAVCAIEDFALPPAREDTRGISTHAVRCALELAYLDAFGQFFREPLSTVTRIIAPELYEQKKQVQYSVAITDATGRKLIFQAITRRLYGFRQCKVKVGIAGQNDVDRLRKIRRYMGQGVQLRLDANEAWKASEVIQKWAELQPFGIAWVEQPVLHEEIRALANIRKLHRIPVMLDESLCGMVDAQQCARENWGDLLNLRLSKCGGFIRTLRLASYATDHDLGYQLGCQVGETGILSAAGRHFACSVRGLKALEGSYDRWLVEEPLTTHNMTFGRGGYAAAITAPGLGIQIDPHALERVTKRKVVLLG